MNEIVENVQDQTALGAALEKVLVGAKKGKGGKLIVAKSKTKTNGEKPVSKYAAKNMAKVIKTEKPVATKVNAPVVESTKKEIVDLFPEPAEIVLPPELDQLMADKFFVGMDDVIAIREKAAEDKAYAKAQIERRNQIRAEKTRLQTYYDAKHQEYWDNFLKKYPVKGEYIKRDEPACVAHRKQVEKMLDNALALVDTSIARYLYLENEWREVDAWINKHEYDWENITIAAAKTKCQEVGVNYRALWPEYAPSKK